MLVLRKFKTNFIFSNIYATNNYDLNFFTYVFNKLIVAQTAFPYSQILIAGDFNFVMTETDSTNRVVRNAELQCRKLVKRNLSRLDLKIAIGFSM